MRRIAGAVLLGATCVAAIAAAGPGHPPAPACEPADHLGLSARVVAREDLGSIERIHVDLKIETLSNPGVLRVGGLTRSDLGVDTVAERLVSLTTSAPRKLRYSFDLIKGVEHHLEFAARSVTGQARAGSAYLRVNLDPRLEPEQLGDVVQYRATMQGR